MPSLFVIQGRDQGRRFELVEGANPVGRDKANPIQLHDSEVSRRHAEVRYHDGRFLLVDLNSSNGTFVNSQRVSEHDLSSGDRLQIGRSMLIFTASEEGGESGRAVGVNIVAPSDSASRIVKTIGPVKDEQQFPDPISESSPWLARARSNLDVMYRTALAASHTLDIDQLLQQIMELIFEWVEADRGCIMLVDQETDELRPAARRNRRDQPDHDDMEISRTILDYVLTNREGVLTSDAREDDRFEAAGSIVKLGVREAICVPLQGRYGVVGAIYIDTFTPPGRFIQQGDANRFTEEHLKLMIAIGHQAALAIEDTSYYSAMVQAERLAAIGQTIATLSHHIKNILQGIRGGSYLIEEGLKDNETDVVKKGWSIVEKNQEKISSLVMDMLSYSKERQPDMQPSQLNDVVTDVCELMQSRASTAGVSLETELAPSLPRLTLDPEGIHRAVLNVVSNAVDACEGRDRACVTISTRLITESQRVQIVVQDNGSGIPAEDLPRIFQVFESHKGNRGTGLGLPVSLKILREHDGDIRAESTPGEGSRFTLEMPAVPADSGTQAEPTLRGTVS